jgi:PAS domain S-box-containing protein
VANNDTPAPSASKTAAWLAVRAVMSILLVPTLLLLASLRAPAASQTSRHVLLIYGDDKDLPMNLIVDRQLRASFREKLGDGVVLFSEYLDISRLPDGRFLRKQLEFLHERYSAHGLDLIVAIDHPALDQIQLHRDWFFPTTPVVFCCITESEYKARKIAPGVTGIPAKLDYSSTLDLALRFHPGTRRVVVVAGATKYDAETVAEVRRDFRPFDGRVEFRYLIGLPMAGLRQEVARLSRETIIIYLSIAQDGAGTFFHPREALDQVSQAASVPIYGYYDSYLGHGIVGGFLASFEIEATNAARLGLRVLAGDKPESPSANEATSCAYMFDWRQLKRWGISEADLPPGNIVRFRNPSFWDLYRWQIVGVLSLCAAQAGLIVGLLIQRARRRRAEKEITQAEERFRQVVESAPNAVVVVNADGKIVLVNAQCEKFFGHRREDLVGQPVDLLVPERFPTEHPSAGLSVFPAPSAAAMQAGRELCGRRRDGSEFPVEVRVTPMQSRESSLLLCVIVDITERKQAEEARMELTHASRLALMGEFTASIAHEINQPLGAILSNADAAEILLGTSPAARDQVQEILGDISKDALRASEVIKRLRALLRKRETQIEPVDLNEVTADVVALVRTESRRRGVTVNFLPAAGLPLVRADKVHVQQVFLNLALNAMDAMAGVSGERKLTMRTGVHKDGSAEVAVSDTGPGILPERLPRLFDPFFSTKKEGMGLGLSIARSLVQAHGGKIWAENNADGGATFRFTLSADREEPGQDSRSTRKTPAEMHA